MFVQTFITCHTNFDHYTYDRLLTYIRTLTVVHSLERWWLCIQTFIGVSKNVGIGHTNCKYYRQMSISGHTSFVYNSIYILMFTDAQTVCVATLLDVHARDFTYERSRMLVLYFVSSFPLSHACVGIYKNIHRCLYIYMIDSIYLTKIIM